MPEGSEISYLWMHEDGNLYSILKLPYEGISEQFIIYPNGFKIPASFVMGD